jgi:ferrous iron transport protein B
MPNDKIIRIALSGNPNSGKTTIFNSLTGSHQKVGNYAGVTVDTKEGSVRYKGYEFIINDLPGTYSLTAYSADEVITRDFIMNEKPDVIVDVIDSTNVERNLYLLLQFNEMNVPVVGALNISDQAASMGISVDEKGLSDMLGIPFVKTVGTKGGGMDPLLDAVIGIFESKRKMSRDIHYGDEIESHIEKIAAALSKDGDFAVRYSLRWFAIKLLEKDSHAKEILASHGNRAGVEAALSSAVSFIEQHYGRDAEIVISEQRYGFIRGVTQECVSRRRNMRTISEKVDRFLLNRIIGFPIFLLILWGIFKLTFWLSEYPMGWLESLFGWLSSGFSAIMPEGHLHSLVVDGIIGGVGGVMSFVPLVIILFMFISFLEDTGYMARAAFIMDKFLHIFGLHGQSFVPMMIGFGCSVPAVMAARTLKNRKDRIITVLVTPFMTCGAKLPVHVLLAGAFFPDNAGTMVMLVYFIGVSLALLSSLLLRKTVLKGDPTPFVMELPPYRMPTSLGVLWHVWNRTKQYFRKAGTILLPASVLIWAITTYPNVEIEKEELQKTGAVYASEQINREDLRKEVELIAAESFSADAIEDEEERAAAAALHDELVSGKKTKEAAVEEKAEAAKEKYLSTVQKDYQLEHSIAGRIGHGIETVLSPLGFDWKIGVAAVTGFAAKEVVVSTLGVLYKVGEEEGEESQSLREALVADNTFNPLVAFVLMLFTIIISPCFAALAVIKAEVGWKWLGFSVLYTTALAYVLCALVYQIGLRFI